MTTQFQPERIVGGNTNASRARQAIQPLLVYGHATRYQDQLVTLVSELFTDITHLATSAGHDPIEFMDEVIRKAASSYEKETRTDPYENDVEPTFMEEPWFESSDEGTNFFEWAEALPGNDPVAYMHEIDMVEIACCLWEAVLDRLNKDCEIMMEMSHDVGCANLRLTLASPDMVRACQTSWLASDFQDSFDWEFVPTWLEIMLTRYTDKETRELRIPSAEHLRNIGREISENGTPSWA